MTDFGSSLVIMNGSTNIKAGLSGQESPSCVIPTVYATPKIKDYYDAPDNHNHYAVGHDAVEPSPYFKYRTLNWPVWAGIIQNYEHMENIWSHLFQKELYVNPSSYPCLMAEPPNCPKYNRLKTTETMFETFNVPSFYLCPETTLSLFGVGKTTGLVLDAGHSRAYAVPHFDGYSMPHAIEKSSLAGYFLNQLMIYLLNELGLNLTTYYDLGLASVFKEIAGYAAIDPNEEIQKFSNSREHNVRYKLPDGYELSTIQIGHQRYSCPQALFFNSSQNQEYKCYPEMIRDCIERTDLDLQRALYENIVICGGTNKFTGMAARLTNELKKIGPSYYPPQVMSPDNMDHLSWMGGSILSSLSSFDSDWITKEQFREWGPNCIIRKCFR